MRLYWILIGLFVIAVCAMGYAFLEHYELLKAYLSASLTELGGIMIILLGCVLVGWLVSRVIVFRDYHSEDDKK